MPRDDSVRVLVVHFGDVADGSARPRPAIFGVGRRDRAVELLAVHFMISGMSDSSGTNRWGFALSENPEHIDPANLPSLTFSFDEPGLYGRVTHWVDLPLATAGSTIIEEENVPLYGLLRPFRQVAIFWNDSGATVKAVAEIFYRPTREGITDLESLERQHGAYRRT